MAGDWIKIEHATPDKPEIFRMAMDLGITPEQVSGCLIRVWIWADVQTLDGNGICVTGVTLDRIACYAGFAQAMQKVGWLVGDESNYSFPNFDRHNGETAKTRALTRKRVQKHRNAKSVTPALPREEKRREESKHKKIDATVSVADLVADGCSEVAAKELLSIRKKKRAALTPLAWSGILLEFRKANLSPDDGIATMSKRGWQSFDSSWIKGNGNATTRFDQLAATAAALTGRNRPADFIEGTAVQVD